jgi:hypothetical protein
MNPTHVWNILGIVAIVCLVISFSIGRNAIWGAFTIGIIVCAIIALIAFFSTGAVNWLVLKDMLTVFVLLGALFEIIGRLSTKRKKL